MLAKSQRYQKLGKVESTIQDMVMLVRSSEINKDECNDSLDDLSYAKVLVDLYTRFRRNHVSVYIFLFTRLHLLMMRSNFLGWTFSK